MDNWDEIYSQGSIHTNPSKEIINLVPFLRENGVVSVLDAGCGTGRHTLYLAQQGFDVYGIDISRQAIKLAEAHKNGETVNYQTGTLINLPYSEDSIDFVLANHSLEYASYEGVRESIEKLGLVLRKGKPFFARVVSTKHPFYKATSKDIYGFSHIGFCIKNNLPVHFFDEKELRHFFKDYCIERLEHITHKIDHDKISVPLMEWVFLGYKK